MVSIGSTVIWMTMMALPAGDLTRTVQVDGRERSYVVHVPAKAAKAERLPVVLVFHGGGSTVEMMVGYTGMNDLANREGFLAVYPRGSGRVDKYLSWNAGNCCGYAARHEIDDVRFVEVLLDDLAEWAPIDSKRVYATGISNGAMMSYRIADELSDRIAAIAPVAGPMGKVGCRPRQPVSVIHFHGTDDQFAPLKGGVGQRSLSRTNFRSVQDSIDDWVKANGCNLKGRGQKLPNQTDDGMTVTQTTYGKGKKGAEVVLVVVHGGGHTWPGRVPKLNFLGPATLDISANEMMWRFFQKHAR